MMDTPLGSVSRLSAGYRQRDLVLKRLYDEISSSDGSIGTIPEKNGHLQMPETVLEILEFSYVLLVFLDGSNISISVVCSVLAPYLRQQFAPTVRRKMIQAAISLGDEGVSAFPRATKRQKLFAEAQDSAAAACREPGLNRG